MSQNTTMQADNPETKAFIAAVKQGLESADAGRMVPYEDVRKWLQSWGTENELPKPKCG